METNEELSKTREQLIEPFWRSDQNAVDLHALARHLGAHAVAFEQCHEWECELEILSAMGQTREINVFGFNKYVSKVAAFKFLEMLQGKELKRALRRHARRTKFLASASREDAGKMVSRERSRLEAIRECTSEEQMRETLRFQVPVLPSSTASSVEMMVKLCGPSRKETGDVFRTMPMPWRTRRTTAIATSGNTARTFARIAPHGCDGSRVNSDASRLVVVRSPQLTTSAHRSTPHGRAVRTCVLP